MNKKPSSLAYTKALNAADICRQQLLDDLNDNADRGLTYPVEDMFLSSLREFLRLTRDTARAVNLVIKHKAKRIKIKGKIKYK